MAAKLPPLNARSLNGESETIVLKDRVPCEHEFAYRKANEVICSKCHAGFFLSGDEHLKDGHLFKGSKRIL